MVIDTNKIIIRSKIRLKGIGTFPSIKPIYVSDELLESLRKRNVVFELLEEINPEVVLPIIKENRFSTSKNELKLNVLVDKNTCVVDSAKVLIYRGAELVKTISNYPIKEEKDIVELGKMLNGKYKSEIEILYRDNTVRNTSSIYTLSYNYVKPVLDGSVVVSEDNNATLSVNIIPSTDMDLVVTKFDLVKDGTSEIIETISSSKLTDSITYDKSKLELGTAYTVTANMKASYLGEEELVQTKEFKFTTFKNNMIITSNILKNNGVDKILTSEIVVDTNNAENTNCKLALKKDSTEVEVLNKTLINGKNTFILGEKEIGNYALEITYTDANNGNEIKSISDSIEIVETEVPVV